MTLSVCVIYLKFQCKYVFLYSFAAYLILAVGLYVVHCKEKHENGCRDMKRKKWA